MTKKRKNKKELHRANIPTTYISITIRPKAKINDQQGNLTSTYIG